MGVQANSERLRRSARRIKGECLPHSCMRVNRISWPADHYLFMCTMVYIYMYILVVYTRLLCADQKTSSPIIICSCAPWYTYTCTFLWFILDYCAQIRKRAVRSSLAIVLIRGRVHQVFSKLLRARYYLAPSSISLAWIHPWTNRQSIKSTSSNSQPEAKQPAEPANRGRSV